MLNMDLTDTKESSFEPLQPGNYEVTCTKATVKDTRLGGQMVAIELTVTSEVGEGKKLFHNFNVENQNAEATRIGKEQLKSFLKHASHPNPNLLQDVNELCGLKCVAHVTLEKTDDYGDQNRVKYFKAIATSATGVGNATFAEAPAVPF